MISKSRSGLNKYAASLNKKSKDYGLKVNASKTKVMAVVKEDERDVEKVNVDGSELEEVDNLRYLGTRIQNQGDVSKEVKSRLSMGLKALNDMKKLWQVQDKETKLRVLTACIFPIATYACEVWILWKVD